MAAFILPLQTTFRRPKTYIRNKAQKVVCQRLPPKSAPHAKPSKLGGEWAGYEASFKANGNVIPIPDYYIPEEFREWGIIPSGFECHTSINATDSHIHSKHLRVLPSVSHFGDHIDVEEELISVDIHNPGVAIFSDGCWIAGNDVVGVKKGKLEKWPYVNMFIRNSESGVGIKVAFDRENGCVVDDLRVILHDWVGEYADSGVMEGGSGYVTGWVDRGGEIDISGKWKKDDGGIVEETSGITLPAGVDVGAKLVDQGFLLWGGWTVDDSRIVLRRLYDDDGKLVYSERLSLRRD